MQYRLQTTREATEDVAGMAEYILRVLKDRQDWKAIMANPLEYHFE